jgi:hypothetical protein
MSLEEFVKTSTEQRLNDGFIWLDRSILLPAGLAREIATRYSLLMETPEHLETTIGSMGSDTGH